VGRRKGMGNGEEMERKSARRLIGEAQLKTKMKKLTSQ
jgi:hypothetical protein